VLAMRRRQSIADISCPDKYSDDEDLFSDLGSQSDGSEDAFENAPLTSGSDVAVVNVAEKVLHWQTGGLGYEDGVRAVVPSRRVVRTARVIHSIV